MKTINLLIIATLLSTLLFGQNPTWLNIGPGAGSDLHFLAIQPDNKDIIYAGGDIEGIFKSTDGGASWNNINNNLAQLPYGAGIYWINEIQIDPLDYQKVYICNDAGLFRSNNGGNSWEMIFPDTIDFNNDPALTSAVGIDPSNTSRIFLGLGDEAGECTFADFLPFPPYESPWGMYRTLDNGITWTAINTGLPDSLSIHTINVIPNSDTVIIATNLGVYRSDNGGNTWTAKNNGLPHNNIHRIRINDDWGDNVATLTLKTIGDVADSNTFAGGIFRSYNMGETWIDITANLPKYDMYDSLFYDYYKFDIYPGDVDIIYVATVRGSGYEASGIYATWDGGAYWELIYTPVIGGWLDTAWFWEGYAFDIQFAPSDPSRVVLCLDDIEISNDTGFTWNQAFTTQIGGAWKGNGLELMNTEAIAFHPSNINKLYVGYDDMGLFRSDDADNSYFRLDTHQDPIIGNVEDADAVKDIHIDPVNGDLYIERFQGSQGGYNAGFSSGGVVFSADEGLTVSDINGTMPLGRHDITVDFTAGTPGNRTIYSALFHYGVYKSTNSGGTWSPVNTGLGANAVYAWDVCINPLNNQELYLAINTWGLGGSSLYKSTNGGASWTAISGLPTGDFSRVYCSNSGDIYACYSDDFEWNTSGGLYRSTDGGISWNKIFNHQRVVDVQVNPANTDVIILVAQQWYQFSDQQHGIYLSENNGTTWTLISQNANHTFFNFARFNPHSPVDLYAGTGGGGLWKTTLNISVGVNTVNNTEQNISVFPNPTTGIITINAENINRIEVMDITGNNLIGFKNLLGLKEIDLSQQPQGIYIIRVTTDKQTITKKVIKQ